MTVRVHQVFGAGRSFWLCRLGEGAGEVVKAIELLRTTAVLGGVFALHTENEELLTLLLDAEAVDGGSGALWLARHGVSVEADFGAGISLQDRVWRACSRNAGG